MSRSPVLLVEDSASDEALIRRALTKQDLPLDLTVVRDGAEAVSYITATGRFAGRGRSDVPRLVLLDLKLPKVPGLEVLRQLRDSEEMRTVPVVVFTSSGEEEDVVKSYGLGCNSYVRKPIEFLRLTEALRQLTGYWLMLNKPAPPAVPSSRDAGISSGCPTFDDPDSTFNGFAPSGTEPGRRRS